MTESQGYLKAPPAYRAENDANGELEGCGYIEEKAMQAVDRAIRAEGLATRHALTIMRLQSALRQIIYEIDAGWVQMARGSAERALEN